METNSKLTINKKDGETRYNHPSFCTVQFSRVSFGGDGQNLFGSSIKHQNGVELTISPAEGVRRFNKDYVHGRVTPYIKVMLSPNQFAELLTTMNYGSGVPGTLEYKDGKRYTIPSLPTKREQFDEEVKDHTQEIISDLNSAMEALESTSLSKKDKKEIGCYLDKVKMNLNSNLSFLMNSFTEQMDRTVTEAKAEVEAFVDLTVRNTGLRELRENPPQLNDSKIKLIKEEEC